MVKLLCFLLIAVLAVQLLIHARWLLVIAVALLVYAYPVHFLVVALIGGGGLYFYDTHSKRNL